MIFSLYIHIPFCKSKCSYCDFFSIPCGENLIPDFYIDALINELNFRKNYYGITEFSTVYIGGGTPSLLSSSQLQKILNAIYKINTPKEITIEANPEDLTKELLLFMQENGINRISCGVQSLQNKVLSYVKRRGTVNSTLRGLNLIKDNWKGIFSLDIISGLPLETEEEFVEDLKNICLFNPHHISMYSLTIEENTPLGKAFNSGKIDYNFEKADDLWIKGRDFLEKNGYMQYEISNFSKPGYICNHNMSYWNLLDYVGIGAGGTGTIYSKNNIINTSNLKTKRWTNTKNIDEYIKFWINKENTKNLSDNLLAKNFLEELEIIEKDIESFEFFMMGLRTLFGVSLKEYKKRFNKDFPCKFYEIFNKWKKKNLCVIKNNDFYSLNKEGLLFLNDFLSSLL